MCRSISSERAYFLELEGVDAVAVLNALLGSANPEEWADYPDGLRPEMADEREYNTLHSAATDTHAAAVLEIMDDIHTRTCCGTCVM